MKQLCAKLLVIAALGMLLATAGCITSQSDLVVTDVISANIVEHETTGSFSTFTVVDDFKIQLEKALENLRPFVRESERRDELVHGDLERRHGGAVGWIPRERRQDPVEREKRDRHTRSRRLPKRAQRAQFIARVAVRDLAEPSRAKQHQRRPLADGSGSAASPCRRCRRCRRSVPRLGAWHPDAARAWSSPHVRGRTRAPKR